MNSRNPLKLKAPGVMSRLLQLQRRRRRGWSRCDGARLLCRPLRAEATAGDCGGADCHPATGRRKASAGRFGPPSPLTPLPSSAFLPTCYNHVSCIGSALPGPWPLKAVLARKAYCCGQVWARESSNLSRLALFLPEPSWPACPSCSCRLL